MFEKAGIPVLSVHLMKRIQLASKCQIMQFSFEYINKNQQTHSEANGKQVKLFEKKISKYSLTSSQSVMLSSLLPLNEIQPNSVCKLLT